MGKLSSVTRLKEWNATPPLVPHDPVKDRRVVAVGQGGAPAANVDQALAGLGGIEKVVGKTDVVVIKVSAQWWNQGMTNVAAVRRVIEQIIEIPGFSGEVIVFENTHFRLADGSGLSRAWTRPSERNVDVPGWNKLGDLVPHFRGQHVGFVGLIDAGTSDLGRKVWRDPGHAHGVYGGDGRGPIAAGEDRDGYHWDFGKAFAQKRSWVDSAVTPLSWPRFTSPTSGLVVDLRDGVFRREDGKLVPAERKLTWITVNTANEHWDTGFTGCCKSAMGVVDMSAGVHGTDPRVRDYMSVHFCGEPDAEWRMAGPLAHFAKEVRAPDLYIAAAEYVAATPRKDYDPAKEDDIRCGAESAFQKRTVVAGTDPVAMDTWLVRNLLMPMKAARHDMYDLDDPGSKFSKFLRMWRQVYGGGTLDENLIAVA